MDKILQEEKNYWIDQAVTAREDTERHAAATRKAIAERDEAKELVATMQVRFNLIGEVISAANGTGYDLSGVKLNLFSIDALKEICRNAEDYKPAIHKKPRTYHGDDLVLMAWSNKGSVYVDNRALSRDDAARINNIYKRHTNGKIPLYALDPK